MSRARTGRAVLAGTILLFAGAPLAAADCPTGRFRADAGPDTASGLEIGKDGRFRYFLSMGAVDEHAEGRWTCTDGMLRLTTEPAPRPALFRLDKVSSGNEAPFSLIVTWPDGTPVPAVDFWLDYDRGDPSIGYTQQDGWDVDPGERVPARIQFAEPFFGTTSDVFPIAPGRGIRLHVVLEPNDMGVAAFDGTVARIEGDGLVLEWRGAQIPYRPED